MIDALMSACMNATLSVHFQYQLARGGAEPSFAQFQQQ